VRQIVDISGIAKLFDFVDQEGRPRVSVIYKLVRRPVDPLPHRKIGKHLRFDVEKCLSWFDGQPGTDGQNLCKGDKL
jgi:hypothetical protein